ncbi:MAG: RNA polymerase sigma factor [Sphingobacteriales bacterium]|nr:RNA polymerase sigma factor [Sphingobacteriales bacterium]MBI3718649.1 RNA polymerase sigma factor [Sphingobacteriales bacterium]
MGSDLIFSDTDIQKVLDEKILIERLKQGDEAAFKTIVETWQKMVYNTALGIVQNEADAEDIAQEVFVKVYHSINTFKGDSKFSTWLYRVTVAKAIDHERKKKSKKRFAFVTSLFGNDGEEVIHPADFNHPGVSLDKKETTAILFAAVKELPEKQRIAFTLNKLEGLSHAEVSEVMHISVTAAELLVHRAKTNLRKKLADFFNKEYK